MVTVYPYLTSQTIKQRLGSGHLLTRYLLILSQYKKIKQ